MAPKKSAPTPAELGIRETVTITDRKVQAAIRRARETQKMIAALSEKLTADKALIKAAMGDAEEAYVGQRKVATYIESIRTSMSATKVKKDYPEIAAKCTINQNVRTFILLAEDA